MERSSASSSRTRRPSGRTENPAGADQVLASLKKVLPGGRLHRVPRHPGHRDILLAVLSLDLVRRRAYSETEMNDYLKSALSTVNARVDHVTLRRYLVDLGFLRRDRAGARYFLNYPRVEDVLTPEALAEAPALTARAVEENGRRRQTQSGPTTE